MWIFYGYPTARAAPKYTDMHVACLRVQLSWSVSEMSITTENNGQLIANNLLHAVQYSRQEPASVQLTHASDNRSSTSPYIVSHRDEPAVRLTVCMITTQSV